MSEGVILLCYAAVLEKGTYYAQHLCLSCLIFFNYAHQNIHNNSNFSMISEIQLVIINIINFILLIFLNLNKFLTENDSYFAILHSQLFFCP